MRNLSYIINVIVMTTFRHLLPVLKIYARSTMSSSSSGWGCKSKKL